MAASLSFDFPTWKADFTEKEHPVHEAEDALNLQDLDDLDDSDGSEPIPSSPTGEVAHNTSTASAGSDASAGPPSGAAVWLRGGMCWPEDVIFAVASELESPKDLAVARSVALLWCEVASGDALWVKQWTKNPRYTKRPPRRPCGVSLAPSPPRFPRFFEYVTRTRADHLYRWLDLQLGWDRLEMLLAPESSQRDATQARKLASILAARDWQLLHRCVLRLQMECSEQHALATLEDTLAPGLARLTAHDAAADERLLARLMRSWRAYEQWLARVCGAFAHHAGSPCQAHLICLLAAERSNERLDHHTPSLLHAGFAAFRQAVVCHPRIEAALRRHLRRSTACVMAEGGFDVESGQLMQQLLDLQEVLSTLDVRDDHLCEERGERFTQETLREALLTPIRQFWHVHSRSWFCGTRIEQADVKLYTPRRRQRLE